MQSEAPAQELIATDSVTTLFSSTEPEDVWAELASAELEHFQDNMTDLCPWVEVWTNPAGPQNHPASRAWSKIIYDKITQSAHSETEGGVNHNASWGKLGKSYLTKSDADWLCQNPCHWYNASRGPQVARMCDCSGGVSAANWCS